MAINSCPDIEHVKNRQDQNPGVAEESDDTAGVDITDGVGARSETK